MQALALCEGPGNVQALGLGLGDLQPVCAC